MAEKYLDLGGLSTLWAKIKAAMTGKQDKLTFDTVPTEGSANPVTSDGIKRAIGNKQDALSAGKGISIYRPQPTSATVIEAVHDHTHDNKTVLDGITAEKVAAWDEASGDDWYYLYSGATTEECFYLGYSGESIGRDQICSASFLVYLRTLTKVGIFAVDIHTRYSSNVRSFTVRRIDGKGNLNFGLYPVAMTSEPAYRFGFYCCFDAETYCVLKVKPIFSTQYVTGVSWVTDAATIATVRSNSGKSDDNPYMFPALPRAISLTSGGSNISATGGTWTSSWLAYQSYVFGGGLDITVDFDINLVGQSTYVSTLSGADVELCDWSGSAKYTRSVTMPKATYGRQTVSKRCSVRFAVADVGTTFRNGFKIKITLPSNYALDANAQVNIGGLTVNGTNF